MTINTKVNPSLIQQATGIKTYEIVQYVSGYLDGDLSTWPANIQDRILEALERKAQDVEHPLTIVHSRCDVDYGETSAQDRFYIHVIASEIVVADDRYMQQAKDEIKQVIADIIAGRKTLN